MANLSRRSKFRRQAAIVKEIFEELQWDDSPREITNQATSQVAGCPSVSNASYVEGSHTVDDDLRREPQAVDFSTTGHLSITKTVHCTLDERLDEETNELRFQSELSSSITESSQFSVPGTSFSDSDSYPIDDPYPSSSDCEEDVYGDADPPPQSEILGKSLKAWFAQHNITIAALGGLLSVLRPHFPALPKDPRTVIGKESNIPVLEEMAGGQYCYFGLESQLLDAITKSPTKDEILLNFHIDGLPLFKSKNFQLTPILFAMEHAARETSPTVVAMHAGNEKPPLSAFLKDFAPELKRLLRTGIECNGEHLNISIRAFICDAPARSYIKGCKYHSGTYGCQFCIQRGRKLHNRMIFPDINSALRTDESFAEQDQPQHHNENSPLVDVGVRMVTQFPLDYQHLILLGVVRTVLSLWYIGKLPYKVNAAQLRALNLSLEMASKRWPSDFSRKPRSGKDLKYWKATEFRQFLLYLAPVLLKERVSSQRYQHFQLLHAAVTIMCRPDLCRTMLDDAHDYLVRFFTEMEIIYGKQFQYYNFHGLLHLAQCVQQYGPLDSFSAFPYENYLNTLKRMVTSRKDPLVSLLNKLLRKTNAGFIPGQPKSKPKDDAPVVSSIHNKGPKSTIRGRCYQQYVWHGSTLSIRKEGDSCVILKDGKVFIIQNFVINSTGAFIIGVHFRKRVDLYRYPCLSGPMGIFRVYDLSARPLARNINEIKYKGLLVPYKDRFDEFACFPCRQ